MSLFRRGPTRTEKVVGFLGLFLGVGMGMVSACKVEQEEIGAGFVIKTRVYEGMGHTYRAMDLYQRGALGVLGLVHKDISGAEVSPKGTRVLYFAQQQGADATDSVLYVFDRENGESIRVAEGRFYYDHDYWSPTGDRLVYKKTGGPIVLFDVRDRQERVVVEEPHIFRGWSPTGEKIAHSTGRSIYEVNELYVTEVDHGVVEEVARKKGNWTKDDFEWVGRDGEEAVVI